MQAPCLMQGQNSLILNDGHSTSIVEALTSGPASDLAMEASFTPQLSYGYYSPYIASVLDIARIMDSFRTAQYQYIPALTLQQGKSSLWRQHSAVVPQSEVRARRCAAGGRKAAVTSVACRGSEGDLLPARKAALTLPVEGRTALVFSTAYAHDVTLSLSVKGRQKRRAARSVSTLWGGIPYDSIHPFWGAPACPTTLTDRCTATGDSRSTKGPQFELVNAREQAWQLAAPDQGPLSSGAIRPFDFAAGSVSCVENVMLKGVRREGERCCSGRP